MYPFRKILCPTDFSEPADSALQVAREMAHAMHAELLLLNVVVPVAIPVAVEIPVGAAVTPEVTLRHAREQAEQMIGAMAETLQTTGLAVRGLVVDGDPADAIVAAAEREHADLVVIATHGRTGWRRLVFGSVAEQVIRHATCPVLTIHEPRAAHTGL
ncbi:MAG: universal stress protein [Acidobacteria bacterium]|jgi:nucleotide-binding universal stress UspA family protein|nr:universal stress protein [Acidobacteriota bacterium]